MGTCGSRSSLPGRTRCPSPILTGATTKLITYSLTPDGWNRALAENAIDDPRLSLKQTFSRPGTFTETLEVTYVYGDTNDVAKVALAEGTAGFLVERRSVPNATDWAIAQKVDVLAILCGKQRKNAPAANGIQTITQTIYLTSVTQNDAVDHRVTPRTPVGEGRSRVTPPPVHHCTFHARHLIRSTPRDRSTPYVPC
jgi:hypothetical protein